MPFFRSRSASSSAVAERAAAWSAALERNELPAPVEAHLASAAAGSGAWVATMTPAELLLARTHGVRPVATVSGTCWFHYGWSWTEGHAEGWHRALDRIRREAVAAGANAVVDVRMRTLRHRLGASMDFTLVGTAVKIEELPPSPEPIVATVPALEFVRLLDADIVPVGIAVGAKYEWLGGYGGDRGAGWGTGDWTALSDVQVKLRSWNSQPIAVLTGFWERIRREAHRELRVNAAKQGNGVLAHTQFGQLLQRERDKQPAAYLGRHIVIGTVVDTRRGAPVRQDIMPVVDMRDELSPLRRGASAHHSSYGTDTRDEEDVI